MLTGFICAFQRGGSLRRRASGAQMVAQDVGTRRAPLVCASPYLMYVDRPVGAGLVFARCGARREKPVCASPCLMYVDRLVGAGLVLAQCGA